MYLGRQRPDLVPRVIATDDYRLGEHSLMKPLFAAVGLRKLHVLQSGSQAHGTAG